MAVPNCRCKSEVEFIVSYVYNSFRIGSCCNAKNQCANTLGVIITKLKEQENYWDATTSGEDLQNGSVSEAIHYFIDTLEWDVSGPEAMSLSIRKFFDQRI